MLFCLFIFKIICAFKKKTNKQESGVVQYLQSERPTFLSSQELGGKKINKKYKQKKV